LGRDKRRGQFDLSLISPKRKIEREKTIPC